MLPEENLENFERLSFTFSGHLDRMV